MIFLEIDKGGGREPDLIGVLDEVRVRGRVVLCPHGACGAWRTASGEVILVRGDDCWLGPSATIMVPNDDAFDQLVEAALTQLESGAKVPSLGGRRVRYIDDVRADALSRHVDRVRTALSDRDSGALPPAPPYGVAWLSVADADGLHAAHVEWRECGHALAVVAGPERVSWADAYEWARAHASVAYTRHPDGYLHKHRFAR